MTRKLALTTLCFALAACGKPEAPVAVDAPPPAPAVSIDDLATRYVILELAMGQIDPNHVDAYYGPEELQATATDQNLSSDSIGEQAAALKAELATRLAAADGDSADRIRNLIARLDSMEMRLRINAGDYAPFDEESSALFMSVAPAYDEAHYDAILEEIDTLLPGDGDLSARVNAFREQFVIPVDQLPPVFEAAIEECRRRTLEHIELPDDESFTIEYVTDKPWSGYNWYQGNSHSLIQVNTELPIFIDRAVDLGCHEGYPGHHTWNALLEQNLVNEAGWIEFTVQPLFAPGAIIAEGSGNYGIELAFPDAERIRFETEVLFPLAGLDASRAEAYYDLLDLLGKLNYSGNEAARRYLNGEIDADTAAAWLVKYSLNTPERALQRIRFFDTYRSYVINYNHGKDQVKSYVEAGDADLAERWQRFERILSGPFLPDML